MRQIIAAILLAGAEGSWYFDSQAYRQLQLITYGFSDEVIRYFISDAIL